MNAPSSTLRFSVQWIGLIGGPLLAGLTYWLLPDHFTGASGTDISVTHAGRATVALMTLMATWWLTEAIDITATALLPIVLLPIAGAATIRQATAPYGSDMIFLFMGGFILALSMQRWGLDKRIALITLRVVGTKPRNMVAGFMIATAMLSAFVSNTATAAMMLPVGLSVIDLVLKKASGRRITDEGKLPKEGESGRNFSVCLMLGIAYASSIGGLATIIGSPPNVVVVGYIRDAIDPAHRTEITFVQWMAFGVPLVAVFLPITWFILAYVLYPIRIKEIDGGREFIQSAYRELGPMKRGEWFTMIVFMCASVLWIARPMLANVTLGGASHPFAGLTDSGIAMLAAMSLFVLPIEIRSRTFAMDWPTALKLPWGILLLFGGGLSLAASIEANGVAEFIGGQAHRFAGAPPILVVIAVITGVIFFSELASNTATATTLIPILAAAATGLGIHPFLLVIPAGLAASCAFMMPVGTPPNAIVFGSGYITMPQMIKSGLWLNLIGIALITLLIYLVAMPLLGVNQ